MIRFSVREMVESMTVDDLRKMKADLDGGGRHLKYLVDARLKELEVRPVSVCATCGSPITDENYTLLFGPADFRKKATFCAQDCMQYFIDQLKSTKVKGDMQ